MDARENIASERQKRESNARVEGQGEVKLDKLFFSKVQMYDITTGKPGRKRAFS